MKTIIDPDEVARRYRAMALANIESMYAGAPDIGGGKQCFIDMADVQAALSRFVAIQQNADRDPYVVGYVIGFFLYTLQVNVTGNLQPSGVQRMLAGIEHGQQQAADAPVAKEVVIPVRLS